MVLQVEISWGRRLPKKLSRSSFSTGRKESAVRRTFWSCKSASKIFTLYLSVKAKSISCGSPLTGTGKSGLMATGIPFSFIRVNSCLKWLCKYLPAQIIRITTKRILIFSLVPPRIMNFFDSITISGKSPIYFVSIPRDYHSSK